MNNKILFRFGVMFDCGFEVRSHQANKGQLYLFSVKTGSLKVPVLKCLMLPPGW